MVKKGEKNNADKTYIYITEKNEEIRRIYGGHWIELEEL